MNLDALFERISGLRVGVLGDFCLDMYWQADMRLSKLSLETPHHTLPIVQERVSLGGAGNVATCLAALRPLSITAYGIRGNDWRGGLMGDLLQSTGVDASRFLCLDGYCTNAYIKPLRAGISDVIYEDPRLDFENRGPLPKGAQALILHALEKAAQELDVLLVCDQLARGCVSDKVRERVSRLGREGLLVLADSRENIGLYHNVIVKPNALEACAATGKDDSKAAALRLSALTGRPAVVTLGGEGCYLAEKDVLSWVPGRKVPPPIDPVGAGDAFHAAFALALAAKLPLRDAADFANTVASVTVAKLGTTGTASPGEVRAVWQG